MSLTSLAIKFAAPLPDLESFDRYLFIGPHPDDIEVGAGATAAKLAAAGKTVCFLICLDGRFGLENAPAGTGPDELALLRMEEARRSARVLGAEDLRFLGLSDGGLYEEKALFRAIAAVVGDFGPDVIFAPDPCVSSECHADHLNVGNAARRVACFAPFKEIMEAYGSAPADVKALAYYMTAKPNRYVGTKGFVEKQLSALFDCHSSQFPAGSPAAKTLALYLKLRSADMGLRCLKSHAEGFRVLGKIHMHCLPEAE